MNEQKICKSHATVLDVTRFNEYCPWIIVQASDCKRDLCYVNLNTSFHYSMTFESLKINYFVCTWISWHKRLISLKCMNSDHVILQTTKKNIFSSIPLCDVIMTLKLNKKSFSPSFFFFTNSLPGGFCHKQILCQENLIYEGNWTSPLGLIKTINTFSKSNSSGNTKYFPLLTWFPLTPFICRWYVCP